MLKLPMKLEQREIFTAAFSVHQVPASDLGAGFGIAAPIPELKASGFELRKNI